MNWYLQRGKDSDVVVNCKIDFKNKKLVFDIESIRKNVQLKLTAIMYKIIQ